MDDRLHMAVEVRACLNDLRIADPAKARLAAKAVLALLDEGSGPGPLLLQIGQLAREEAVKANCTAARARQAPGVYAAALCGRLDIVAGFGAEQGGPALTARYDRRLARSVRPRSR